MFCIHCEKEVSEERVICPCCGRIANEKGIAEVISRQENSTGVVNEKKYVDLDFSEGSKVIIVNGPLEGYEAVVESVQKDKGTAKVLVNMFGRKTAAEVEFKNLKTFTN